MKSSPTSWPVWGFACAVLCCGPQAVGQAREGAPAGQGTVAEDRIEDRVAPVSEIDKIELSTTASDSGAYLVLYPNGFVTYVPLRSAMVRFPPGSRSTRRPVADFATAHAALSAAATALPASPDDKLLYFFRRGSGSATAVWAPKSNPAVQGLFDAYGKATTAAAPCAGEKFPMARTDCTPD